MAGAASGAAPGPPRALLPEMLWRFASEWAKPAAIRALRRTSRGHASALRPAEVPAALLDELHCHLPIRREVAFFKLEKLAKQGAGDAMKAVVESIGDETQEQELRKWALETLKDIAEPGEDWAINAIVRPGGPLWAGNSSVAKKAIEVLPSIADSGNTPAIAALASKLSDGRFSCRAGLTIAQIAEGAANIDGIAVQAVLAQLNADSHRVQANALMALGYVGRGHDIAIIQELKAKTADANEELRRRAVAALARVSGLDGQCVREKKHGVLSSSIATGVVDNNLHGAAKSALLNLDSDR